MALGGSPGPDVTMTPGTQAPHIRLFLTAMASPFPALSTVHKLLGFTFSPLHTPFLISLPHTHLPQCRAWECLPLQATRRALAITSLTLRSGTGLGSDASDALFTDTDILRLLQ